MELDWGDDRVLHTAWELLNEADRQGGSDGGGGRRSRRDVVSLTR